MTNEAQMTDDKRQQKLKKHREAYQQKKEKIAELNAQMTDGEKQEKLKRRREAYQQKKEKICAQHRQIYANMQSDQKKARIEHINELKRNTANKDSIAMQNPAYSSTEQEVSISTPSVNHRKHVTPGERQTLLHRRNKQFTTRRRKNVSVSSEEDASMTETGNNDTEPLHQPQVMIYDIPSSMFPSMKEADTPTQTLYNGDHNKVALWPDIPSSMSPTIKEVDARIESFCNDVRANNKVMCEKDAAIQEADAPTQSIHNEDHGNDEVIFEDTNEDEYMFSSEEWGREVEVEIREDEEIHNPDPYDFVYSNIPKNTHVLKPEENCRLCHAKKFKYETKGLCCRKGQILASPDTPPELMRLWTSND
ncbi:uncharacterized protein LOC119345818 [Triticum dicoccoides]|uniref:uncharacterized protein LOC119345818 n=1 Tax=Triticum dicoccoides TaxID=85692 RepID=UPI0018904989|nr:uncharacterized protein LOC119345818 [Triticum dicoccoides]